MQLIHFSLVGVAIPYVHDNVRNAIYAKMLNAKNVRRDLILKSPSAPDFGRTMDEPQDARASGR